MGFDKDAFEQEVETIVLPLEDGTEQEYGIILDFDFEGKTYFSLSAIHNDELDDEETIFEYTEDGDDLIVNGIEDDAEYERVWQAYCELCKQ